MSGFGGSSLAPFKKNTGASKIGTSSGQDLQAVLNLLATLASPAFTGVPTAPTAAPGTDTTQLASTAFVQAALAELVDSSPATLDTLNELAAALGDDPNFATTMTNLLATKAALASPTLTGTPAAPTPAIDTNTTQLATTAFVLAQIANDAITPFGLPLSQADANNDASIDFTLPGGYDRYLVGIDGMYTNSGTIEPELLTSDNSGTTFDTGASHYAWRNEIANSATSDTADDSIVLYDGGIGAGATDVLNGFLIISEPHNAARHTSIWGLINAPARNTSFPLTGRRVAAEESNAIRIKFATNNIAGGKFTLYGVNRT